MRAGRIGPLLTVAVVILACAREGANPASDTTSTSVPPSTSSSSTTASSESAPGESTTSTASVTSSTAPAPTIPPVQGIEEFSVPGRRPHDVAVTPDGSVWYTAQRSGSLDRLDPATGEVTEVPLGEGSAPHGVIVGPAGDAWVTDQGLDALVRVDHGTLEADVYPAEVEVGVHTAAFAPDGLLWFTGQRGYVGRFDPDSEEMALFDTDGGGPYGITVTPGGDVYFAGLSGSYIARVDTASGEIARLDPPTSDQGARRVWSDSAGDVWVSYWNTGHLARYSPADDSWGEWTLPGESPQAYAVYVDETDRPWVSDFGGDDALLRFDPATETFETVSLPTPDGEVRQLLGRPGEVWGAESAVDALVVVRYGD